MYRSTNPFIFYTLLLVLLGIGEASSGKSLGKGKLRFNHLQVSDGLSSDVSSAILADSRGYIWLGTEAGLNRFDGYQIVNYPYAENSPQKLSNGVITALFEDREGVIWIGTEKGLNKIDPFSGKISRYLHLADDPSSISNNSISSISQDKNGAIWVGTFNGLNKITDPQHIHFKRYYTHETNKHSLQGNYITSLKCDKEGNLWVGTKNNGLSYILSENISETFPFKYIEDGYLSNASINCIVQSSNNDIYVGTQNGFSQIENRGAKIDHYTKLNFQDSLTNKNKLEQVTVYDIAEDEKSNLWIATFGSGIYCLNPESKELTNYKSSLFDSYSIGRNHVSAIEFTSDGFLWVASREKGFDFASPNMQRFTHIRKEILNENSLSENIVKSICEDKNGNFWFGTYGGGLNKYDPTTGKYQHFTASKSKNSLCNDRIDAICFDHKGMLWIGTEKGLSKYQIATNKFESFLHNPNDSNSIVDSKIWSIYPRRNNAGLWIATDKGLEYYSWDDNRFYHLKDNFSEFKITFNNLKAIYEDTKGYLWVGTWGDGINRIKLRDHKTPEKLDLYKNSNQSDKSLSNDLINFIFEDSMNRIWIGTQGGLNLYNDNKNNFSRISKSDGLSDNVIKGILEDEEGYLWVSTQNGLSRINPYNLSIQNYYQKDGLQGNTYNLGACLKSSSKELLFGGTAGVSMFTPEVIKETIRFPNIHFTGLRVNSKYIIPADTINKRVLIDNEIDKTEELTLRYDENVIGIDFTVIEFISPQNINFAYKLEGVDKNWNYVSYKTRTVNYAGLKPGEYKFLIKASTKEGEWGSNSKSIHIKITPPFYNTCFSWVVYISITLAALLIIKSQVQDRRKMKRDLEDEKKEHARRIELNQFKLQFFTDISHEFRTPLTLIAGPLQRLIKQESQLDETQKHHYLETIDRSVTVLTKLINQILDFRKAEQDKMTLSVTQNDVNDHIKKIANNFDDYAAEKNIEFTYFETSIKNGMFYDADKIEKIIFNLLSNAFKFTPLGGRISIKIYGPGKEALPLQANAKDKENYFSISVIDTGVGIDKEHQKSIFDRFTQLGSTQQKAGGTGIGLSFAKQMVELHGGYISVNSKKGEGCKFTVWMPAKKKMYNNADFAEHKTTGYSVSTESVRSLLPDTENQITDNLDVKKNNFTILIVEDYPELRNFIAELFSNQYNILLASNGKEGLEKTNTNMPDLIISDVMMPEMDGLEMTRLLKQNEKFNHIPIIILTAKGNNESKTEGLTTGAEYYFSKPFNVEQLQLTVKNIITSRNNHHAKFSKSILPEPSQLQLVSANETFLKKLGEIIEEYIDDSEFGVEKLAVEIGFSTVHLYRKIKSITGKTPNEFIRAFRMKRATQLLSQSDLLISEVAYSIGFNDPKYFRKCFKSEFNMTPSEYRLQNIITTEPTKID